MEINRTSIGEDKSYIKAEKTADFINALFDKDMVKPSELLHTDEELSDTAMDAYSDYIEWVRSYTEAYKTDAKEVEAFCKAVYYSDKCHWLNVDHLNIVHQLATFVLYLSNQITKEQLHENMYQVSIFSGKQKANVSRIRRAVRCVEALLLDIQTKQLKRSNNKKPPEATGG